MSEISTKPTTSIHWADGGSPYTTTDPGSSKKDAGYNPGTGAGDGEIPTAEHFNWLLREYANHLNWLAATIIRIFSSAREGITASDPGQRFIAGALNGETPDLGTAVFKREGDGGIADIDCSAVDGENIYYGHNEQLYAAQSDDGTALASWTTYLNAGSGGLFQGIAADGRYVYVGIDIDATGKIYLVDRETGATYSYANDHGTDAPAMIRANGTWIAMITDAATPRYLYSYEPDDPPVYWGSYDHTVAITALAIHGKYGYIGSQADGTAGARLAKIDLQGAGGPPPVCSAIWTVSFAWTSGPTFNALACDGERIYGATDRNDIDGGTTYGAVHCFSEINGARLWSTDLGAGVNADKISVDARYVLAVDLATYYVYVLDKTTGHLLAIYTGDSPWIAETDGLTFSGHQGKYIYSRNLQRSQVMYLRQSPNSNRPLPLLALPIE